MRVLPVRAVALGSDLSPAALGEQLRGVIGGEPTLPFTGSVAPDGFSITRMNEYRSTFMPRLRGWIAAAPGGGSRVALRLRPPGTTVVFMGIWLAFLAAVAALIVAAHARGAGRSLLFLLAPAALGGFSWYLMIRVFASDARWAIERLVEAVPALRPGARP
jgi:hypothetical protein